MFAFSFEIICSKTCYFTDLIALFSDEKLYICDYTLKPYKERISFQNKHSSSTTMDKIDYSSLIKNMPVAYALHEMIYDQNGKAVDYRFLDINTEFENLTGLSAKQVIGVSCIKLLPNTEYYWIEKYDECIKTGKLIQFDNFSKELDRYFQVTAYSPAPAQFIVMFFDITERISDFNKSEKVAAYYQSITESALDGVVIIDSDFNFSYVSNTAFKMLGYELNDMPFLIPNELTHPDDLKFVLPELEKLLANPNKKISLEYRYKKKDGGWLWIESTFSNLFDNPEVHGIVINFRDITERKEFTNYILQNEARYRLTQEVGNIGSWEYSANDKKYWNSHQLRKLFGVEDPLDNHDEINRRIKATIIDNARLENALDNLITKQRPYKLEFEIIRQNDGERRILFARAELVPNSDQNNTVVRGIVMDITEQRTNELKLKKSEALLAANLIHSRFGIWSVNTDNNLLYANQTFLNDFYKLFGMKLEVGKSVIDCLPEALKPLWLNRYKRAFDNNSFIEEDIIELGDEKIYIEVSVTPIVIDGKVVGGSFYGENITVKKQYEDLLRKNTENLNKVLKASTEFILPKIHNVDYEHVTLLLREITGAKYVIFNWFENEYSYTKSISGFENLNEIMHEYLGIDVFAKKWNIKHEMESLLEQNEITILNDISKILSYDFNEAVVKLVSKVTRTGEVALVALKGNNRVVGSLVFIFDNKANIDNVELIELFSYQMGQYIERTNAEKALQLKMDEMQRFHKLTVNRELNMIELKREVNALLIENGKEPKYRIVN